MLSLAHSFIKDPIAFFNNFTINKPEEDVMKLMKKKNEEENNPTVQATTEQLKLLSRSALLLELEQIKSNDSP